MENTKSKKRTNKIYVYDNTTKWKKAQRKVEENPNRYFHDKMENKNQDLRTFHDKTGKYEKYAVLASLNNISVNCFIDSLIYDSGKSVVISITKNSTFTVKRTYFVFRINEMDK